MPLDENFLRELNQRVDIESIISPYVPLKRRGKTFVGLCPFHNEKTPSFTVYPDTQSFYCFGCAAGGDAVTFIRRIENLDYIEAVKSVAASCGMKMPEDGFDETLARRRRRILAANREAARFFNNYLMNDKGGAVGHQYFNKRGLADTAITHFGLGFAPDSWDALRNHLRAAGFSDQEMLDANLVKRSQKNNSVYDNFRNRIMFPLIDLQGNVIAFSGRVLDDTKPKYVNTGDTLVYKKGNAIYSLNFAKNANDGKLILVEGNMDAVSLHQAGFTNAVASFGTALTSEQAGLLARYCSEIYLCYDGDEAGMKATRRALDVFANTGVKTRVVAMPPNMDPDDVVRVYGKERFRDLLDGAANKIEYEIIHKRREFNILTDDGKMNFINACCEILADTGKIEAEIYASRLSAETGISKEAILSGVERRAANRKRRVERERQKQVMSMLTDTSDANNPERSDNVREAKAEEIIITSLVRNPDYYKKFRDRLNPEIFVTSFNRRVFKHLLTLLEEGIIPELMSFSQVFDPQEMNSVTRIFNRGSEIANTPEECADCISILENSTKSAKPDFGKISDEDFLSLFNKKT